MPLYGFIQCVAGPGWRSAGVLIAILSLPLSVEAEMGTGEYTGNGLASLSVSGLTFQPDVVMVTGARLEGTVCRTATMAPGFERFMYWVGQQYRTDGITSLDADGFTVGGG